MMRSITSGEATWLNRGTTMGCVLRGSPARAQVAYCTDVQDFVSTAVTWEACQRTWGCRAPSRCPLRARFRPD